MPEVSNLEDQFLRDLRRAVMEIKCEHDLARLPYEGRTLHIVASPPATTERVVLGRWCGYEMTIGGDDADEMRELLAEIYDWTRYKDTPWGVRVAKVLGRS